MKHVVFLVLLASLSTASQGQGDEWLNQWHDRTLSDSIRHLAIQEHIWSVMYRQPDSAYHYADIEERDANASSYQRGRSAALRAKGASWYLRGNLDEAEKYFTEALSIARLLHDAKLLASNLNNMAIVAAEKGKHGAAVRHYEESLAIATAIADSTAIANALGNIGLLYQFQKDYERAVGYHQQSLGIEEHLGNLRGQAATMINLGVCSKALGDYNVALGHYERSLAIRELIGDRHGQAAVLNNIASLWFDRIPQAPDSAGVWLNRAMEAYKSSLEIREAIGDSAGTSAVLMNIAAIYNDLKQHAKALRFNERAYALALESGTLQDRLLASEALYITNRSLSRWQEALFKHEEYTSLKDSLFSLDNLRETARYEARYEYKLKALEDSLRTAAEMAQLTFETKLSVERSTHQRNTALLLAGLVILALILLYQRRVARANLLLKEQEANYRQELLYATINTQEDERRRIARDLHDEVGAMLSTVKLHLAAANRKLAKVGVEEPVVDDASRLVDETVSNVRRISKALLPATLEDFGLAQALSELIERVDQSGELRVEAEIHPPAGRLPLTTELGLFRVMQEMINNALKHAYATHFKLEMWEDEKAVYLRFEDNGVGFDPDEVKGKTGGGLGLKNIETRVGAAGGTMKFNSAQGKGTSIEISILKKTAAA
jgi:signal transduction histidine kinase